MVNTVQLAAELGQTHNDVFKLQVKKALAELETKLGYPVVGVAEADPEPTDRIFSLGRNRLWHRIYPAYDIVSVELHRDKKDEVVSGHQLSQNGHLHGDWYNAIKFCDDCKIPQACWHDRCEYVKVTAKWGFGAPILVEESGEDDKVYTYLPADLYGLLAELVERGVTKTDDIQSESRGTRSYSKYPYRSVWDKHEDVLERYRHKEPRF